MNFLGGIVNLFRFDKTNWKAVALCFVAATVFWFFNALNKEHTATISFPVAFQYDQSGYIPLKTLPEKVLLNITGTGWDLLRRSLGFKVAPLLVALERPSEIKKVSPATVLSIAATQLGQTKINHVASDTLLLSIEPRKNKKVKLVLPRNQLRFELGFGIASAITISPDSVLVEGPSSMVAKMPDSILLAFPPGRNSNPVNLELEIGSQETETIIFRPRTATVKFLVSELTDIKKFIKVIVLPSAPYRSQIFMDSVSVTFRLPSKQKDELTQAVGLFALIDLHEIEPGISKVVPSIKGRPPFFEIVSVDSLTIRKY